MDTHLSADEKLTSFATASGKRTTSSDRLVVVLIAGVTDIIDSDRLEPRETDLAVQQ